MALLRCLFLGLAVACLVPSCTAVADHSDVIVLTDATFSDKVKEKDTLWFIKFCVPWCKHCAKANMLWDDFLKAMDMEDGVEIAQVDCTVSKATCSKVGIRSYPTFKLFYDGKDHKTYKGKRDVAELKTFAMNAATELSNEVSED